MKTRLSPAKQWQFYERQTGVAKQRAMERLKVITQIEALVEAGMTKSSAVLGLASVGRPSAASMWNWLSAVEGVQCHDRLAYLVPGFRGGGKRADIDHDLLRVIATDYLRPERPSWAECVRRVKALATQRGVDLPHARTLWRRLRENYGGPTMALWRGEDLPAWLLARIPANDR